MARKIDLTKSPESHCPKFEFCNINKCSLSKKYEKLQNDASDPAKVQKERCVYKRIRVEIGSAFNLKFKGMTSREFNGTNSSFLERGIIPPQNEIICQDRGINTQNSPQMPSVKLDIPNIPYTKTIDIPKTSPQPSFLAGGDVLDEEELEMEGLE